MKTQFTPSTHHVVPQPAGVQCAEWYSRANPSAEDILYALAHTKGVADELLAALQRCADECERAGNAIGRANSPSVAGGLLDSAIAARAAIAKVQL